MRKRMVGVLAAASAIALLLVVVVMNRAGKTVEAPPSAFASAVDLSPLGRVAVYEEGRLKSFESFAASMMHFVSGPNHINGQPAGFTYLDMMFRPEAYDRTAAIYVRNKPMRGRIVEELRRSFDEALSAQPHELAAVREEFDRNVDRFLRTGMIGEPMLTDPRVQALLEAEERDLIRTQKHVQQIRSAMAVKQPQVLANSLRIVPPVGERAAFDSPWTAVEGATQPHRPQDAGVRPEEALVVDWAALADGWRRQDAVAVNGAVARLAATLPHLSPDLYPSLDRLAWESRYFRAGNMTWVWLVYLLAVVFLVMSIAYRWSGARWIGLGVFAVAFGLHTAALGLRWYVSGRWPNANMFEAVTTSAWFGGCLAVVLEILVRRGPMRGLFALGSAVASMTALMCVHFMPVQLNANISNKMPVLHDVWLYIHTNVVIFSYCLIAMAAVSATAYLLYRLGGGAADFVRAGGAGALILRQPTGEAYLTEARTSAGQVFDGATMVLMELAFILLWSGLVMGAIWADHSWGRPWGWDPKEVFALNTFIILALLIHVRLKAADKGLWTALLALTGFGVMLFNWIVINFVIVGLHSYA